MIVATLLWRDGAGSKCTYIKVDGQGWPDIIKIGRDYFVHHDAESGVYRHAEVVLDVKVVE